MNKPILIAILLTLGGGAATAQTAVSRDLHGAGSWKTDGEAKRAAAQWSLDLQRSRDGTVSGVINVADSPLLGSGRVRGRFDGRLISGTIVDEQGTDVARFNGLLTRSGFRGRYVDRTGETGDWEWEGEIPSE